MRNGLQSSSIGQLVCNNQQSN